MKTTFYSIIALSTVLLSGCVTSHPQNAVEFRAAVPGAFLAKVEKYEVAQPYHEVAMRFEKMAPKCLNTTIKTVSQSTTSYQVIVTEYKPTVILGDNRTELHLQQHHAQGVMKITEEPDGGYYLMVVDAIKAAEGTTRIEYYGPSVGHEPIIDAIKGWASGKNIGCPDLTKI
ncbi:MAG: hypothetical protein OEO19_18250 [Gammaproteobacteria bacterium]|nr:hypothetical protein [Gammaproteobacteria bacterium]